MTKYYANMKTKLIFFKVVEEGLKLVNTKKDKSIKTILDGKFQRMLGRIQAVDGLQKENTTSGKDEEYLKRQEEGNVFTWC